MTPSPPMTPAEYVAALEARLAQLQAAIPVVRALYGLDEGAAPAPPRAAPSPRSRPRRRAPARTKGRMRATAEPAPGPRGVPPATIARAKEMKRAGHTAAEIAGACGIPRWKAVAITQGVKRGSRAGRAPVERQRAPEAPAASPSSSVARRCGDCGQRGTDPARCEHCGAPR